ncbi:hypothetical protein AC579_8326 [Lecanosticta acicola]|uniref:Uncharacterized protein n=1 Tax=Lecanosticta acicola TaxID=111012 RepID=A0AAI8YRF0_9PEZI|nr:hypothetical protein AC579_8326 [Lecanosticta acicola]
MDGEGEAAQAELLLQSLESQKEAYLEAAQKFQELLTQNLLRPNDTTSHLTLNKDKGTPPRTDSNAPSQVDSSRIPPRGAQSVFTRGTGEESDAEHESDELLYAQNPLETENYDLEGLRQHLVNNPWDEYGWQILRDVLGHESMENASHVRDHWYLPTQAGPVEDRSHLSGYQVWDVGPDGAPLNVDVSGDTNTSRAMSIWNCIKEINPPNRERRAVGRITIMRELSPTLFGAVHYTLNRTFDMDEIFKALMAAEASKADVHRGFDLDPRRQCSKIFVFQYFTIVADDCVPMDWQMGTRELDQNPKHIRITRCNSVVALAFTEKPIRKVRNPARRNVGQNAYGNIYDPWSSWHLLNLQCYPDLNSSTDMIDTSKHFVNGPEAFMVLLLGEFRDAQRRFEDINRAITRLITPSADFMFDAKYRDDLLFEDEHFTFVRRYFWAYQTLGIMNESIRSIIDEFEHNFTEELWEGTDKTLWPLVEPDSPRSVYYKKKMAALRKKFEAQMAKFRTLIAGNEERRTEIRGLREELYVGTSVKESRKSVEATETTVQQGHNIKLLTLVSIFFLPSQFVTSVFGMTNMPTSPNFWTFGVVLVAVCVPFFILIGSLNSNRGMMFWRHRVEYMYIKLVMLFRWLGKPFEGKREIKDERERCEDDAKSARTDRPRLRRTNDSRHESFAGRAGQGPQSGQHGDRGHLSGIEEHDEVEPRPIQRASSSKLATMIKGARTKGKAHTSEV